MMKKPKLAPPNKGLKIKAPKASELLPDDEPPIFSLQYLHKDYCISRCTDEEKIAFVDRIHRISQLKWKELRQLDRHKLGYEQIHRTAIRSGIPSHIMPDVKHFIAFRFHGKAPMVGYRDERIFYIFWIDRGFTLYDHGS